MLHGRRFLDFDGLPLGPKVHCCWLVPGHLGDAWGWFSFLFCYHAFGKMSAQVVVFDACNCDFLCALGESQKVLYHWCCCFYWFCCVVETCDIAKENNMVLHLFWLLFHFCQICMAGWCVHDNAESPGARAILGR